MPGGDYDDDIEDQPPEDIHETKSQRNKYYAPNNEKFMALYDDAKHRNLRQEHIYAKCYDKECTFKP
jgi:hypothetical protein